MKKAVRTSDSPEQNPSGATTKTMTSTWAPVCDISAASAEMRRGRGGGEVKALLSFERHMMRVLITSARILSTFFAETCAVTSANKREDGESLNKQRWVPGRSRLLSFHKAFEGNNRKT